ncbi:hypothetical protein AB5N19_02321 [Seiridium cardinale]
MIPRIAATGMHVAAKGNTAYPGLWEKGMVILIEGGDGAFCLRPWSDKRKAETLMIREADAQLAHTPARDTWDDKLAKARLKRDKGPFVYGYRRVMGGIL